jgi:hypothetical protein
VFLRQLLVGFAFCFLPFSAFAQGTNWNFLIYYPDTGLYSDQVSYTNNPASNVTTNDKRSLDLGNVTASNLVAGSIAAGTNLTVNGINVLDLGGVPSAWEIGLTGWLVPRNAFSYDPNWTTNIVGWLVPK